MYKWLETRASSHARLLTVLGNEKRLLILSTLWEREMTVGVLADRVELSQSALSQHLSKLRRQGLVSSRRSSQKVFYWTTNESVRCIFDALGKISSQSEMMSFPEDAAYAAARSRAISLFKQFADD